MDKYQSEAEAIKKEKKVKEGYQLYLAYMENRALNNKQ